MCTVLVAVWLSLVFVTAKHSSLRTHTYAMAQHIHIHNRTTDRYRYALLCVHAVVGGKDNNEHSTNFCLRFSKLRLHRLLCSLHVYYAISILFVMPMSNRCVEITKYCWQIWNKISLALLRKGKKIFLSFWEQNRNKTYQKFFLQFFWSAQHKRSEWNFLDSVKMSGAKKSEYLKYWSMTIFSYFFINL